jgi:uncharacterized protein (TIGR02594 family)
MTIASLVAAGGPLRMGASGPAVKTLQLALRVAGHELVVDGGFGAITRTAVRQFQGARRLNVDGEVGPITAGELDAVVAANGQKPVTAPLPSVLAIAPHLAKMRAMTGTKEVPGPKNNPLIIGWARSLAIRYPDLKPDLSWYTLDSIAWCGLACGEAVGECDPGFKPPAGLLGAGNWANWGQKLDEPTPGAILVFVRKGGHHVTLYESEMNGRLYCRGGNQTDTVNVSSRTDRPIAIRWPPGLPIPNTGRKFGVTANAVKAGKEA